MPQLLSSDLLLLTERVKPWRGVCDYGDRLTVQEDLTRVMGVVDDNGLTFKTSKCNSIYLRNVTL